MQTKLLISWLWMEEPPLFTKYDASRYIDQRKSEKSYFSSIGSKKRLWCYLYKREKGVPSRVQLTPHPKQCMKSKAWLGYNRRCVVNVATMAGTPRSKANWIWFSLTSLGDIDRVVALRCIKKAPKICYSTTNVQGYLGSFGQKQCLETICQFN